MHNVDETLRELPVEPLSKSYFICVAFVNSLRLLIESRKRSIHVQFAATIGGIDPCTVRGVNCLESFHRYFKGI